MEETPEGTPVGVDDPYAHAGVCDHLTDEGRCRFAFEHPEQDPEFARQRREADPAFACPVVAPERETPCASDRASSAEQRSAGHSSGRSPREDGEERSDEPRASDWDWSDCPHYRSRATDRECTRCGLEERRMAHDDERPLLEEHHLSYAGAGENLAHEITVYLCRWCHAKVHGSWARVDDDVNPDPEALAEREQRRGREQAEAAFETAAERFDDDGDDR